MYILRDKKDSIELTKSELVVTKAPAEKWPRRNLEIVVN